MHDRVIIGLLEHSWLEGTLREYPRISRRVRFRATLFSEGFLLAVAENEEEKCGRSFLGLR
jgi:hypothetical protein